MRASRHLPQARHAGGYLEPLEMLWREMLRLVVQARSRADEGHFAAQDVDQLRKLIETRLAQPAAKRRHRVGTVELVDAAVRRRRARTHDLLDIGAMRRFVGVGLHRPE